MRKLSLILALSLIFALPALAQAAPEGAAARVQALLDREARSASDPWAKFLLSQPVQNVRVEEGRLLFSLPAWDPGVDALEGAQEDWLQAIWRSVLLKTVDGEAEWTGDADSIEAGDLKNFVSRVKTAAAYAKKQFDRGNVRRAVAARILPTDLYDESGAPTEAFAALTRVYQGAFSQAQLEVALSAQKTPTMGVTEGPDKLKLVFYAGSEKTLAGEALEEALRELSATDLANAMTEEEIALAYAHAFARRAATFRNGGAKGDKRTITFSFSEMLTGTMYLDEFAQYARDMTGSFDAALAGLVEKVRALPDYPLRDQPETGVLTSQGDQLTGTKLFLRAEDDALGRYVVLVKEGRAALSVFLRAGEACEAYVDQGEYTLLCAKGSDWYGPVRMFGDSGEYVATQGTLTVLDDTHYHNIILGAEADLPVREAGPDEFTGSAPEA